MKVTRASPGWLPVTQELLEGVVAAAWESHADFQAFAKAQAKMLSEWCSVNAVCTFPRSKNYQKAALVKS